jgi:hypothetical protein
MDKKGRLIENKKTVMQLDGIDKPISVCELLIDCVTTVPDSGLTIEHLETRLKLLELLTRAKESEAAALQFTDNEFKAACECIRLKKWKIVHPFIVEFGRLFR